MNILYTVKYRKTGCLFWTKIKKVKGDSLNEDGTRIAFFLENETKIEIPLDAMEIIFSKERFKVILDAMERESGQRMAVR